MTSIYYWIFRTIFEFFSYFKRYWIDPVNGARFNIIFEYFTGERCNLYEFFTKNIILLWLLVQVRERTERASERGSILSNKLTKNNCFWSGMLQKNVKINCITLFHILKVIFLFCSWIKLNFEWNVIFSTNHRPYKRSDCA